MNKLKFVFINRKLNSHQIIFKNYIRQKLKISYYLFEMHLIHILVKKYL